MTGIDTTRPDPVRDRRPAAPVEWWWRIAVGVAAGAAVACLLGLLLDGAYAGDAATAEMLRGFDAVTLGVVLPALTGALLAAHRGSVSGRLTAAALLTYLAYTYAYYLFGTGFNDLLLLHAAVFTGSLTALALSLASLDATEVASGFSAGTPARVAAAVLAALALALGVMWVIACVAYALTGEVPAGSSLVETDTVVHLGIVLDLTVLVPLYSTAAVLLWRRRPWGWVLAIVALVSGLLHQVSYLVALLFQDAAGVPGSVAFDPVEPVILLLYAGAVLALLTGHAARQTPDGRR